MVEPIVFPADSDLVRGLRKLLDELEKRSVGNVDHLRMNLRDVLEMARTRHLQGP